MDSTAKNWGRLQHHDVLPYLLETGRVDVSHVVDGDLRISERTRRNHNFEVVVHGREGWFLKQADERRQGSLEREAVLVRHLKNFAPGLVDRALPETCDYDSSAGVLVVSLLADAVTVEDHHVRAGRFSKAIATSLGAILAEIHKAPISPEIAEYCDDLWVATLLEPDFDFLRTASGASLSAVRMIQNDQGLSSALASIRDDWTRSALIHGDLKWDNIVLTLQRGRRVPRIIDWESGCVGDAAWDVGSILAAYHKSWVRSIAFRSEDPQHKLIDFAAYPIDRTFPGQSSLWRAYTQKAGLRDCAKRIFLERVMRMVAARMIAYAIEVGQFAHQITSEAVLLLQVASNISQRPLEAARHLCGIADA